MAYAVRLDPIQPLNAAELDAIARFEAEQACADMPEIYRSGAIKAYMACRRSQGAPTALRREVERREAMKAEAYRQELGLPDMTNIPENRRHIKLMESKS